MTNRGERAVLNHLIETCKDAERGFRHVAEYATDPAVKSLFLDIASQRAGFAADLLPHAQRLGGARGAEGTTAGALHRTWMDLRHALSGDDQKAVIVESQYAEVQKTGDRLRALETVAR
jgi:uncharacterized protein (TIGR02284 family)